jgi:hypothetical protein
MSNLPKLFDAKALHTLAEKSLEALYELEETDIFGHDQQQDHQRLIAIGALRFCAAHALVLKEVSLLPIAFGIFPLQLCQLYSIVFIFVHPLFRDILILCKA